MSFAPASRHRRAVSLALALLLPSILFGLGDAAPPTVVGPPAYGDMIVEGSNGDVSGFLSAVTSDAASHAAANYVFSGLVRYDKELKIEGELAESWTVSPDGRRIVFHLRKGVKWHDGAPFTSADVMFTYRKMIDPKTPTAYAEDFLQVKKAEAPDPYTFAVEYEKPYAPSLISWGMHILPKHLLEKYADLSESPLMRNPIGTGPFRFVEWKTGTKVVFRANPDYFEGRPYIDRVTTRVIPDQAIMFLELKAKGVDEMTLTPLQYTRLSETKAFKASFEKYRYGQFAYTYLGFRLDHPIFSDKRVRQALSYAVNRQELVDGVLFGLGREATGPYKPGTWVHNENVRKYPYDAAKAKAMLAEAGWADTDGDGILDRSDGKGGKTKFAFTIMTNAGNESRAKAAAILQRGLAKVGVKVEIRTVEWSAFINEFVDKRKFEAILLGWNITPDPDQFDIWSSAKTGPKELNHVGFKNAEVDRLLEDGRRTFDTEKRKKAYFRIQEILAEEQPYLFLYAPDALVTVHKRFKGIEPAATGISHNFNKWYVPKAEQRHVLAP